MSLVCQSISAPVVARLGKPSDLRHPVADRDQKHPTVSRRDELGIIISRPQHLSERTIRRAGPTEC